MYKILRIIIIMSVLLFTFLSAGSLVVMAACSDGSEYYAANAPGYEYPYDDYTWRCKRYITINLGDGATANIKYKVLNN